MQGQKPFTAWDNLQSNEQAETDLDDGFSLSVEPIKKKEPSFAEKQNQYLQACHGDLFDPNKRKIDLSEICDAVHVKWVGKSSDTGMSGTIEIKKHAIKDRQIIEWLENRELYEMWEQEQKKTSRKTTTASKRKPRAIGEDGFKVPKEPKPKKPKIAKKDQNQNGKPAENNTELGSMLHQVSQKLRNEDIKQQFKQVGFFKKKRSDLIGVNQVKIEGGLIKYEYSNKFNLRVNNFRRGGGGKSGEAYSSLDKYVQEQNLREAQALQKDRVKYEEQNALLGVKQENGIKSEVVKNEDGSVIEPDCYIEKIDYT